MTHGLTNESIIFNISCWFVFVFIINLVPERYKYVTIKCVFKRNPPLLTFTFIAKFYVICSIIPGSKTLHDILPIHSVRHECNRPVQNNIDLIQLLITKFVSRVYILQNNPPWRGGEIISKQIIIFNKTLKNTPLIFPVFTPFTLYVHVHLWYYQHWEVQRSHRRLFLLLNNPKK